MPLYDYECVNCGYEFAEIHSIATRHEPEKIACPKCNLLSIQKRIGTPKVCDPVRVGVTKVPSGFKDVLRQIHARTPGSRLDV